MQKDTVIKRVIEIIFVLSVPFMTLLMLHSARGTAGYLISLGLSFVLAVVFAGRLTRTLTEQFRWSYFFLAGAGAFYTAYNYAWQGNAIYIISQNRDWLSAFLPVPHSEKRLLAGLILLSFPAIGLFFYYILRKCVPYILHFIRSWDTLERNFIIAVSVAGAVLVGFSYLNTTVCYYGENGSGPILYDIIYTSDCTEIYVTDAYMHVMSGPNDIRQPLFGLFALPAALICKAVSAVLFFLPGSYAIALGTVQIVLLAVTAVMLWRILKLKGTERIAFMAFLMCSYTYLLYGFLVEQYVLAYFYVILFLYVHQRTKRVNYVYFGAVSTLITSGVLFPLISKEKKLKDKGRDLLRCLVLYFGIVTLCGQLPQFLDIRNKLTALMIFTGEKISWYDKWVQFTNFLQDMIWAPQAQLGTFDHSQYQIIPAEGVSYIGIIILLGAVLGFVLHYKDLVAQIAAGWAALSILVLFVVGWGTAENGLILYALYFAWAYMVLIYKLLQRVIPAVKVRYGIIAVVSLMFLVHNGYGLIEIYRFGVQYYPTVW